MAKKNIITAEQATEALDLLTQFVSQNSEETAAEETSEESETEDDEKSESAEDSEEFELPSDDEIDDMDKAALKKVAAAIELDVDSLKEARIKELLKTLNAVLADDEAEKDDVDALAAAFGLTPDKKQAKTEAAIKEFIENLGSSEEEEESEGEESEDSEDDEKPKGKKSTKKDADEEEESEEEESEDADEEEDEKPSKKTAKDDEEEESEEEESEDDEELSDEEKESRLEAYNAAAEKPLKTYEKLEAKLGDNKWGTPYMDGEEGYCCGLPLEEGEEVDGKPHGICAVTGAHFLFEDDEFVPYTPKKAGKKTSKK